MPSFSEISKSRLETCHNDLQVLFNYVIRYRDCSIIYGHRTPEEQFELYKKGRKLVNGVWVIEDKNKIVTYKDGIKDLSKHNKPISEAVDAIPYPEKYDDMNAMYIFVGFVLGCAQALYDEGYMKHRVRSGIDWDRDWDIKDQRLYDAPHIEIIN